MEDHSFVARLRDNVIPPLLVAAILAGSAGGWAAYQKLDEVARTLPQINADIARLRNEVDDLKSQQTVMKSQMVGWDTVARMERSLAALSAAGKGDKAMAAMASVLRTEVETRKEKSQ